MIKSQITSHYEVTGLPSKNLDQYESKLTRSDSVYSVIEIIYQMFCDLMKSVGHRHRESSLAIERTLSVKTYVRDMFMDSPDVGVQ